MVSTTCHGVEPIRSREATQVSFFQVRTIPLSTGTQHVQCREDFRLKEIMFSLFTDETVKTAVCLKLTKLAQQSNYAKRPPWSVPAVHGSSGVCSTASMLRQRILSTPNMSRCGHRTEVQCPTRRYPRIAFEMLYHCKRKTTQTGVRVNTDLRPLQSAVRNSVLTGQFAR